MGQSRKGFGYSFVIVRSRVTLRELKAEAVRLGGHPNMAYRLVTRLSDETEPPELERRDGKIYPTAHLKGNEQGPGKSPLSTTDSVLACMGKS